VKKTKGKYLSRHCRDNHHVPSIQDLELTLEDLHRLTEQVMEQEDQDVTALDILRDGRNMVPRVVALLESPESADLKLLDAAACLIAAVAHKASFPSRDLGIGRGVVGGGGEQWVDMALRGLSPL
jgi:hypothetical protein